MSARNKWIADTAARLAASPESSSLAACVHRAINLAYALESARVAPWLDAAPAPSETAAKVGGPWQRIAKLAVELEKEAHYYGALNIFPVAGELKAIARANGGDS